MATNLLTTFIGIESICILHKEFVTIACNIMLKGKLYDEPQYTNIFLSYEQLAQLLINESNSVSNKIQNDINYRLANETDETIQIDLPGYINNSMNWEIKTMYELDIAEEDIPFECYRFGKA